MFFAIFIVPLCFCEKVKFVAIFLRHGARSPIKLIDKFSKYYSWPMGPEELTPLGQRQHYLLGRVLREKYIIKHNMFPNGFDPTKIYLRSTDIHRTIMSAQSFAMGLYSNGSQRLSNKQLKNANWKPPVNITLPDYVLEELNYSSFPFDVPILPVTNYALSDERLLFYASCPIYGKYRSKFYETEEFKKIEAKYKDSLRKTCRLNKVDCSNITKFDYFLYADYIIAADFDGRIFHYVNDSKFYYRSEERRVGKECTS